MYVTVMWFFTGVQVCIVCMIITNAFSANNSNMHNFCPECRADLKFHIQQRLENLSLKSVLTLLFHFSHIFQSLTQAFAVTLFPLAIPS